MSSLQSHCWCETSPKQRRGRGDKLQHIRLDPALCPPLQEITLWPSPLSCYLKTKSVELCKQPQRCKNKSWMSEKDLRLLLSHSWGMNKHMAAWERKTCRGMEGDRRRRCRKCNRNSWGLKSRPQQASTVRAGNEATALPLIYTFANERLHVNEGNEGASGHEKALSGCSSDQSHYLSSSLSHSVILSSCFFQFCHDPTMFRLPSHHQSTITKQASYSAGCPVSDV